MTLTISTVSRDVRACLPIAGSRWRHSDWVMRSSELSDRVWARVEPVLPRSDGLQVGLFGFIGMLSRDRAPVSDGVTWRDLPARFGPWQTVWKRHHRIATGDAWDRLLAAVQAELTRLEAGLGRQRKLDGDPAISIRRPPSGHPTPTPIPTLMRTSPRTAGATQGYPVRCSTDRPARRRGRRG